VLRQERCPAALGAAGFAVRDVRRIEPSLEDVFMAIAESEETP